MSGSCRFGRHSWDGCVCTVCGKHRDRGHDYVVVERQVSEPDCCCWSSSDPCTGPQCGTFCDSYYPGRGGSETITERCSVCGQTRTLTYDGNESRSQF